MRTSDGIPTVFLAGSDEPVELRRLGTADPDLRESLIQQLVFEHPAVLPIQELDPSFAPLIPIGMEIGTEVGPIDALYISPDGRLTVVEAKLWRNPEARRQVIGQIIDYATALSSWSYERLDAACQAASECRLWQLVDAHGGADGHLDEASFVDAVSRNLRLGQFLLLVVGDGIREEVQRMASYVQTAPRLQFHLALVELRIFESEDATVRAVVPSVVARTEEIPRAVVRVDVAPEARVEVDVTVPSDDSPSSRRKLTMEQFFAEMTTQAAPGVVAFMRDTLSDFDADPRFQLLPQSASVSLRLRNPQGSGDFTVMVFKTNGQVYTGWLVGQCERAGVPDEVATRYVRDVSDVLGVPLHDKLADSLAAAVDPRVLERHWDSVRDRIEALAQDVLARLAD